VLICPEVRKAGSSYCDQDPVLANGTIRENILGVAAFNAPWYEDVVQACQLSQDFASLPKGDQSLAGSKGLSLSGGQRKRVALARALYSKLKFAVLDDVLSGLDARTEESVARAVFGPQGILRRSGTTVIFCTQSAKYVSIADQVVVLRDGRVSFSGPPANLVSSNYIPIDENRSSCPASDEREDDSFTAKPPQPTEAQQVPTPRRVGTLSEHKFYLSTIGPLIIIPWTIVGIIFAFLFNFGNVWLQFWASDNEHLESASHSTSFYLGIYFLIEGVCASLMGVFSAYGGCVMTPMASKALHGRALKTLLRAPLAYFSKIDAAVLTGYFSQDMNIVDLNLSFGLSNTLLTGLTVLGKAAVIGVASPWVLISYPVLAVVLFMIQKVYLRTSTQLRFLILEAKDPLL
jgi:ABC-type multidrug transport system fused ATPase/permease subunit